MRPTQPFSATVGQTSVTATTLPPPRLKFRIGVIVALFLLGSAGIFRGADVIRNGGHSSDTFSGEMDYLMDHGEADACNWARILAAEGPDAAYRHTSTRFQDKVSRTAFDRFLQDHPDLYHLHTNPGQFTHREMSVEIGTPAHATGPATPSRWSGYIPVQQSSGMAQIEMVLEGGEGRLDGIRILGDGLPYRPPIPAPARPPSPANLRPPESASPIKP